MCHAGGYLPSVAFWLDHGAACLGLGLHSGYIMEQPGLACMGDGDERKQGTNCTDAVGQAK